MVNCWPPPQSFKVVRLSAFLLAAILSLPNFVAAESPFGDPEAPAQATSRRGYLSQAPMPDGQAFDDLQSQGAWPPTASSEIFVEPDLAPEGCIPCQPAGKGDGAASKYPTVKLTGFFQADAVLFSQDAANIAAVGDIQDGADFRRARLAGAGEAWDNVSYYLEMDFAFPGRPNFMDVWLDIDMAERTNFRIGQFRQPFSMDAMTSVRELPFLERALPFAFVPFRQIGAMAYGHSESERYTWAASVFRFPTDPFGGNVGDNGGYGLAIRQTGLLIDNSDGVLHIGGGYSLIDPANDRVQYRNQPEVFVGETGGAALVPDNVPTNVPFFVDTGLIATKTSHLFNAELGASLGSLYVQSEAFYTGVDQLGGPQLSFSGAYAHMGYFLTGEKRPYNRTAGVFGRVEPLCPTGKSGGYGAWEATARWSYIDLNDDNIRGGRLNDVTMGMNWYLNRFTKFQFNYIHAFLNSPINGNSDADIVAVRAQVDF